MTLGYLDDPFAKLFWDAETPRRYPIMNRGTYIRTAAIDQLVDCFLDTPSGQAKQIVSLGAGTDTRYFRILSQRPKVNLSYHELDFAINTTKKIAAIRRSPELLRLLQSARPEAGSTDIETSVDGSAMLSPTYSIHAVDLRDLARQTVTLKGLSSSTPTLLLSECCLVYLDPSEAEGVIRYFIDAITPETPLGLVVYEPIRPNDAFGKVMISNLASRGIVLQTLKRYSSLTRQKLRLKQAGFRSGQQAADMDFLYERWVEDREKERVAGLEMLDEIEEWQLLAQHYCVAWGWRDSVNETQAGGGVFAEAWKNLSAFEGDDEDVT